MTRVVGLRNIFAIFYPKRNLMADFCIDLVKVEEAGSWNEKLGPLVH